MGAQTIKQYEEILDKAHSLFVKKNHDYGDSWRLLRLHSITDQIWVKAKRIRELEEMQDTPQVPEGVETEYMDILNYCVMALIKLSEGGDDSIDATERQLSHEDSATRCE